MGEIIPRSCTVVMPAVMAVVTTVLQLAVTALLSHREAPDTVQVLLSSTRRVLTKDTNMQRVSVELFLEDLGLAEPPVVKATVIMG